ncbi:hypothetical protein QTN25_004435 [Entamoeba marina]
MTYFFILYFCLSCLAVWDEADVTHGVIADITSATNYKKGWVVQTESPNYVDYLFDSNCCNNNEMVLLSRNLNSKKSKNIYFVSNSENMTLETFKFVNIEPKQQQTVDTENMKNRLNFYFGCFESATYTYDGASYTCRESVTSSTLIDIYNSSISLFGDSVNQDFVITYHQKVTLHPYVSVGGVGTQSVTITFQLTIGDSDLTNGVYYLFSGDQTVTISSASTIISSYKLNMG